MFAGLAAFALHPRISRSRGERGFGKRTHDFSRPLGYGIRWITQTLVYVIAAPLSPCTYQQRLSRQSLLCHARSKPFPRSFASLGLGESGCLVATAQLGWVSKQPAAAIFPNKEVKTINTASRTTANQSRVWADIAAQQAVCDVRLSLHCLGLREHRRERMHSSLSPGKKLYWKSYVFSRARGHGGPQMGIWHPPRMGKMNNGW